MQTMIERTCNNCEHSIITGKGFYDCKREEELNKLEDKGIDITCFGGLEDCPLWDNKA